MEGFLSSGYERAGMRKALDVSLARPEMMENDEGALVSMSSGREEG